MNRISLLRTFISIRCLASRRIHSTAADRQTISPNPQPIYDCNLKISSLGRNRDIKTARELFDRMPHRDIVTYASMIDLHIKNGDLSQAESLFREMPERNVVVDSAMVNGYAKSGRIHDARRLFDEMPVRNVFTWTSLISGYCFIGQIDQARRLFEEMPVRNIVSWTTMLLGYARNGLISDARDVFDQTPEKNVVSWTAMIKSYLENGLVCQARELFDSMPHRNLYSWNIMISGYLDSGDEREAIELFQMMPQRNAVSWTSIVSGLAKNGSIGRAREYFDRMPRKDTAAWNAMITACTEGGKIVEGRELFDSMPDRNIVTWNAMIDGYVKSEHLEEAARVFCLILHSPLRLNETTLTSVLGACQSTIEIMEIHALAAKLGYDSDTSLVNALVTIYSRSGDLASSRLAFEELVAKDVVSWTSMILAYSNHGCGGYALQVFSRMLRYGAEPDRITLVGVLSACSHAGLVEKGKRIFQSMSRAYGIEPKAEHYSCLVDLLGRAGHVDEAKAVVNQIPREERDEAVLGALLGACRVHDDIDVASSVGQEVIELDPAHSGGYVLLANAYASRRQWDEVARIRKLMKERKVKKVPGYSQIEVNMRNHVFYAGDRSHPQVKDIYAVLEERLLPHMMDVDYPQSIHSTVLKALSFL